MRARTPHMLASKGGQWEDYRRLYSKEEFPLVCNGMNSNQQLGKYMLSNKWWGKKKKRISSHTAVIVQCNFLPSVSRVETRF
jgi:hypothetical protein